MLVRHQIKLDGPTHRDRVYSNKCILIVSNSEIIYLKDLLNTMKLYFTPWNVSNYYLPYQ